MRCWPLIIALYSPAIAAEPLAATDTSEVSAVVAVSAGAGWADMDRFAAGVASYFEQLEGQVPGFSARSPGASHRVQSLGLRAQLRLPRRVFIESGVTLLDNRSSTAIAIESVDGEIGYRNRGVAIPLLFGAYLPVTARVGVTAAIGPVLLFGSRSDWDHSIGEISSFRSGVGGGLEIAAGTEIALGWRLQATAGLRYRYLQSAALTADGPALPPVQPLAEISWSGITGNLGLQIVID